MKNNRKIKLENAFLDEHKLTTISPPKDSLFWKMWDSSKDIGIKTLQSPFIQGIKFGTLDPLKYGAFNISDAYYCFQGVNDYLHASNRTKNKTLKSFLEKKYKSYKEYNDTFPDTWRIKDATSIIPTEACKKYVAFESTISQQESPIYTLIAMLPCEFLWAWIAEQLSPTFINNLYAPWIKENNSTSGSYAIGNFLEIYLQSNPIDEDKACTIYEQAMNFELQNFNSI